MDLAADRAVRKEWIVHGALPREDNPAEWLTIAAVYTSLGIHPGRHQSCVDGCRPRQQGISCRLVRSHVRQN